MNDAAPAPPDDAEVRWLLVRTAASLARLWARLLRAQVQPGRVGLAEGALRDLHITEPWLSITPVGTAVTGVVHAVLLAQGLLLDASVSTGEIDRRRVCLVIQHISCASTVWSEQTLRMAGRLGVRLAARPFDELHGSSLHTEIYRLDGTYAESAARAAQARPRG